MPTASSQDGEQVDGAVTDDRDRLAGPGLGGDGAEPTGAEHDCSIFKGEDDVHPRRVLGGAAVLDGSGTRRDRPGEPSVVLQ
jgi:hypothetical protein